MGTNRRPHRLLLAVAVVHAVLPLALLGTHLWFGYDETVYLSQLNAHVPAGLFSAPRARGTTLLAAPVTLLTSSVAAVRLWLAALSGIGLYGAFRPWLRLRPGFTAPVAALLFSTVWTAVLYSFEAMPNEWVAFGVAAACGQLLLHLDGGGRARLAALASALAVVALLRPSDALYCAAPLLLGCALAGVARRRRVAAAVAVVVGTAAGSSEWVLEAYARFGGLGRRVALSQAEQGGSGLHFAGAAQARALAGPLLCRYGCHADASLPFRLWWAVLAALVVAGALTARRDRSVRLDAVPTAVGLAMAAQYVFTVTYAAPRFLLPTYAALSLPAAAAARRIVRSAPSRRLRLAVATGAVAVLAAHVALQVDVLVAVIRPDAATGARMTAARTDLLRADGLRPPCIVLPDQNLAYATRCSNSSHTAVAVRDALQDGARVLWIRPGRPSARCYGVAWTRLELPGREPHEDAVAYLSGTAQPRPVASGGTPPAADPDS